MTDQVLDDSEPSKNKAQIPTIDIIAEDNKRYAVIRDGEIVVKERIPLHIMHMSHTEQEFHFQPIAKNLQRKYLAAMRASRKNTDGEIIDTEVVRGLETPSN